jgi:hypothetical protein
MICLMHSVRGGIISPLLGDIYKSPNNYLEELQCLNFCLIVRLLKFLLPLNCSTISFLQSFVDGNRPHKLCAVSGCFVSVHLLVDV